MKRRIHEWAVFFVGLSCGCSPALAWYGHTPDRTKRIEVHQRELKQWLVIGDRESNKYDAIATQSFVFASGSDHFAVAALRFAPGKSLHWHVLRDFREGAAWDSLVKLFFAPRGEHLAYIAERNGRWRVVVDEEPGEPFDFVDPGSFSWSPGGERWGYIARDGPCVRGIVESRLGLCYRRVLGVAVGQTAPDDIVLGDPAGGDGRVHLYVGGIPKANYAEARSLLVDPTGKHWAIIVEPNPPEVGLRLVVDGTELPVFDEVTKFVWAPDGHSFVYAARRDKKWFVVDDGRVSRGYDAVETPVFSNDGLHSGHIGRSGPEGFVFVDGKMVWSDKLPVTALTLDEHGQHVAFLYRDAKSPIIAVDKTRHRYDIVIDGSLRFSQDGRHWAAIVGALDARKLSIVMDGKTTLPFDSEELFGGGLYPSVNNPLGTWVSGELELYLRGQHGRN